MLGIKQNARLAGLLYLLTAVMGPFVLIYVPGKLFVSGDASASVRNILAHESLFRASIVVGILAELLFVSVVLLLYQILKDVDRRLAALMAILILLDVPLSFLGSAHKVALLAFAKGGAGLSVFEPAQRDVLVLFLDQVGRQGVYISEVFWGLWLLPLGQLVYRSRFLPRFLGVWLGVNGFAYLVLSTTGLLAPQSYGFLFKVLTPAMFGELALAVWLAIRGVKAAHAIQANAGAG